jgi:hypothetical protein
MRYLKIGLAGAGIAWLPTIAGALFWNFAPSTNMFGLRTSALANAGGHSPGSIGKGRYLMLVEATRLYKESGAKVSQNVADGIEFARVPFLNPELERQGAKRRVRSTDGLSVKMHEIS